MTRKNKQQARKVAYNAEKKRMVRDVRKALNLSASANVNGIGSGGFGLQYSDSNVIAPVAKGNTVRMVNPVFSTSPQGNTRVRKREYFGDVEGNISFEVDRFAINPGVKGTFPWLSGIAERYEKYRFHALRFSYEPIVATSISGAIMTGIEYDVHDSSPGSKLEFMAMDGATRAPPWNQSKTEGKRSQLTTMRLVRTGSVPVSADRTLYDVGDFLFATSDFTDRKSVV